jgi:cytosine/adenosine deaminase-related metal-dependent hydrolase
MHLAEQRKELDECVAEHGTTPVQLMADEGVLDERFVAVHATHLSEDEIRALGEARSFVCVCRTTERDLGDGLFPAREVLAAGARLCTGVDSHAISDPFEEARAIELDERSRLEGRTLVSNPDALLAAAGAEGYAALGLSQDSKLDRLVLDASDVGLLGCTEAHLADAIVYSASPRAVSSLSVDGATVVEGGRHVKLDEITRAYRESSLLRSLGLA